MGLTLGVLPALCCSSLASLCTLRFLSNLHSLSRWDWLSGSYLLSAVPPWPHSVHWGSCQTSQGFTSSLHSLFRWDWLSGSYLPSAAPPRPQYVHWGSYQTSTTSLGGTDSLKSYLLSVAPLWPHSVQWDSYQTSTPSLVGTDSQGLTCSLLFLPGLTLYIVVPIKPPLPL